MKHSDFETKFLQQYFHKIKLEKKPEVTIENLQEIILHHTLTFPFENFNPYLKLPVLIGFENVFEKMVKGKRGGYCFEQNTLLKEVLDASGYETKGLAARVLWNIPEGTKMGRGHMLLLVKLNGKEFIADAGFGGMTLTAPLELHKEGPQSTPHGYFKIQKYNINEYKVEAQVGGNWKPVYQFSIYDNYQADYEIGNWYASTHPKSIFVNGIIVTRPGDQCRNVLMNTRFVRYFPNGEFDKTEIENVADLRNILETVFDIELPANAEVNKSLESIFTTVDQKN